MDASKKQQSQDRVDNTFRVIDAMEDLRDIWRATAPVLDLDEKQRDKALKKISSARKALDKLENTL